MRTSKIHFFPLFLLDSLERWIKEESSPVTKREMNFWRWAAESKRKSRETFSEFQIERNLELQTSFGLLRQASGSKIIQEILIYAENITKTYIIKIIDPFFEGNIYSNVEQGNARKIIDPQVDENIQSMIQKKTKYQKYPFESLEQWTERGKAPKSRSSKLSAGGKNGAWKMKIRKMKVRCDVVALAGKEKPRTCLE